MADFARVIVKYRIRERVRRDPLGVARIVHIVGAVDAKPDDSGVLVLACQRIHRLQARVPLNERAVRVDPLEHDDLSRIVGERDALSRLVGQRECRRRSADGSDRGCGGLSARRRRRGRRSRRTADADECDRGECEYLYPIHHPAPCSLVIPVTPNGVPRVARAALRLGAARPKL